jgi:hypothetical protein
VPDSDGVITYSCPILGTPVNCSFDNGGTINGSFTGRTPAEVRFINQPLASTGGFGCPTAASFNAAYASTAPSALFLPDSWRGTFTKGQPAGWGER